MSTYISEVLKIDVAKRAAYTCRMPEAYAYYRFHCEHIIALQHGGRTHLDNLAYACSFCNWKKGPNLSTVLEEAGPIIRLFHPRKDNWTGHFEVLEDIISPKSSVGAATIKLLEFNHPDHLIERRELIQLGLYR